MFVGAHISLLENWPHVNFWYKKWEKRYENDEIQWEEVRFTFYFKILTKKKKKYRCINVSSSNRRCCFSNSISYNIYFFVNVLILNWICRKMGSMLWVLSSNKKRNAEGKVWGKSCRARSCGVKGAYSPEELILK